ncbi:MAG TPA: ABC transporter permease [Streptosporangiaceae bacterium]
MSEPLVRDPVAPATGHLPTPAAPVRARDLTGVTAAPAGLLGAAPVVRRRRGEFLYYALRNPKLIFGLSLELVFVLAAVLAPVISAHGTSTYFLAHEPPSASHWLGTDYFGHDVFAQLVYGLRTSFLVGALGALCASAVGMALGFIAGYRGGLIDDALQMVTNIMVMIPSLVLLIVIGAYLQTRGVLFEGVFIGLTTWPWVARAVRAQTFTLRTREFVDLARLSGKRSASIVIKDIAPNMASYLFLVVVLLFGSSMLLAASYDFLGLGPTNSISLGTMMNQSMLWSALALRMWWWFIPPGVVLTGMVFALLIANVGLDEVFNPKLRTQ